MNSFMFCAILSFSSSLAFKVSFHKADLEIFEFDMEPVLVCTRYEFIYKRGDGFSMNLRLQNNTLDVTKAVAVVKNESGIMFIREEFWPEAKELQFYPISDKITIDVELTVNNICARQRILVGREVSTTGINVTTFKYNNLCIKDNHCFVLVDPTKECGMIRPQPCEDDESYTELGAPADDQRSETANEIKNNLVPSSTTDNSKQGAENTYFIIMIVASITAAVALLLQIITAIRQRCLVKNPPGIPQMLPTNTTPYYENVLFRTECQQEIGELEQHEYYDVVAVENEYEEIDNQW